MPKVPSLPHRPRQSIDSQAVDMWTTLKKRSPHAHSHNKCKCQARSDIDQEAAVRFTSIRHITHIRRAQPTDSPEEAFCLGGVHAFVVVGKPRGSLFCSKLRDRIGFSGRPVAREGR